LGASLPDQPTPVKTRAARARLCRLAALTGARWPGVCWPCADGSARAMCRSRRDGQTCAVLWLESPRREAHMAGQKSRSRRMRLGPLPDDLYDYLGRPVRRRRRPATRERSEWTVTDDWPDEVPITEAEIEVFEAWFGDLFDELFSTRH